MLQIQGFLHTANRMLRIFLLLLIGITVTAAAGPVERLTEKGAILCDESRQVCIRGSLIYRFNPRMLEFRGRIQSATGPGLLSVRVVGENRDGFTRRATLEMRIRGRYSEIVEQRQITDHPDVEAWTLERIVFKPDEG